MAPRSVFDFLRSQQRLVVDKIYSPSNRSAQWACLAVFQSLSTLARCAIMRVLYLPPVTTGSEELTTSGGGSFSLTEFTASLGKAGPERINLVLEELLSLFVIVPVSSADTTPVAGKTAAATALSAALNAQRAAVASGTTGTETMYCLNPLFQSSLQNALHDPKHPWTDTSEEDKSSSMIIDLVPPTPRELAAFSAQSWNNVLGYIVGILPREAFPHNIVYVFVGRAGLMAKSASATAAHATATSVVNRRGGANPSTGEYDMMITAKGYEFMLKDYAHQVWEYILQVFSSCRERSQPIDEVLSLLFMLSYTEVGRGYPVAALTKAQKQIIFEASQVGIVYMHSPKATFFYPTSTATNMIFGLSRSDALPVSAISSVGLSKQQASSDFLQSLVPPGMNPSASSSIMSTPHSLGGGGTLQPSVDSNGDEELQIIVETNLQVTAYVRSELHLALLRIFVDLEVRMPNMAIGRITREKSKEAFQMGIRSAQIVDFLLSHAHPAVRKAVAAAAAVAATNANSAQAQVPPMIVPENAIDQLVLWESELHRIHSQPAVVFDCTEVVGMTREHYRNLVAMLESAKGLLWKSDEALTVACKVECEQRVLAFVATNVMY